MYDEAVIRERLEDSRMVKGPTKLLGITPEVIAADARKVVALLNQIESAGIARRHDPNPERRALEQTMIESYRSQLEKIQAKYLVRFDDLT